ncbi:hypothetical protein AK95_21500 [Paenibacillus sp. LC231]|nr:hypothetical protein AK95_21500 [Paenibacillus sp. LC231]
MKEPENILGLLFISCESHRPPIMTMCLNGADRGAFVHSAVIKRTFQGNNKSRTIMKGDMPDE